MTWRLRLGRAPRSRCRRHRRRRSHVGGVPAELLPGRFVAWCVLMRV